MKCTQHSSKYCWCGGHNITNAKKNKLHNATKSKLSIQAQRKFKTEMCEINFQDFQEAA